MQMSDELPLGKSDMYGRQEYQKKKWDVCAGRIELSRSAISAGRISVFGGPFLSPQMLC